MALDLTDGEKEVLGRLANGMGRKEIAEDLGLVVSTIHNRIYEAQRRNHCTTTYHLLAMFVRDAVVASLTAQEDAAEAE